MDVYIWWNSAQQHTLLTAATILGDNIGSFAANTKAQCGAAQGVVHALYTHAPWQTLLKLKTQALELWGCLTFQISMHGINYLLLPYLVAFASHTIFQPLHVHQLSACCVTGTTAKRQVSCIAHACRRHLLPAVIKNLLSEDMSSELNPAAGRTMR